MGHALAQVTFQGETNLPADRYVNTFHFEVPGALVTALEAIALAQRMVDFYEDDHDGAGTALRGFMSNVLSDAAGAHFVRIYDQGLPAPRLPIFEQAFTWSGGGQPIPSEVALVMSFQGEQVSGEPQARKRGRIFWGPLEIAAVATTSGRPNSIVLNALVATGLFLLNGNATGALWSVFSPTNGTLVEVDNGWVDNAFDTQRRRGEAATSRVAF